MKFFSEMFQVVMKPKSLLIFFPSSKFSQKKSLKKIFNFWVEFISGTFFEKILNWGRKFITILASLPLDESLKKISLKSVY